MKLEYLMKLKKFIPFCFLFIGTLGLPQPSFAEEKIEVIPIIQSSKGLSGKNFNYCLLYTSPSPRDQRGSRMPSSA